MAEKHFSVARLKVEDSDFTLDDFSSIADEENAPFEGDDGIHRDRVVQKNTFVGQSISLYFEEGEDLPRPSVVFNTQTRIDEENPRERYQIERKSQSFFLIEQPQQRIFISDFRKKGMIEKWLSEKIQKKVIVKNIIDRDQFVNEVKSLNSIYLSAAPDLFSREGILGEELNSDIHNYGVGIKRMQLRVFFEENTFPERAKQKIIGLFSQQNSLALEKLEISGRYDEKFERIFNAEGIIDKIEITACRGEDGLFNKDEIFNALIAKIQ